jgi:hypothetical protein
MDVGQVTTSLYLVPAAAIVISFVWLSQFPSPLELAGGAIALGGVVVANTRRRRDPARVRPSAEAPRGVGAGSSRPGRGSPDRPGEVVQSQ